MCGRSGNNAKNRWYKFLSKKYLHPYTNTPPIPNNEEKAYFDDVSKSLDIVLSSFDNSFEWDMFSTNSDVFSEYSCFF
ncbi:hypothetical protein TRFO_05337 [Tritrichomonas foetus]|uniref:HTH myb-type domain-containing protein n=1 Tax=Tritrichomonas foetus TaxID=1144522 RepID=A0A1J4K7D1_9EUKA|nr:hypothetical protein TRFO_05337 [Tritrichomonas foetus]|eukprot:OHT07107.1 hypothetical protein TRFO_05337 [Tritrichomonas foetus]